MNLPGQCSSHSVKTISKCGDNKIKSKKKYKQNRVSMVNMRILRSKFEICKTNDDIQKPELSNEHKDKSRNEDKKTIKEERQLKRIKSENTTSKLIDCKDQEININNKKPKISESKKSIPKTVSQTDKLKKLLIKRPKSSKITKCNKDKKDISMFDTNKEKESSPSNEEPIKLTEFVPKKIKLKRDFEKKQVVNQTISTVSPSGSIVSSIRICSLVSDSNSIKSK